MSGEKVKPQSPFKTLANILQEFLFPALRVSHMFGGGPSGRNRSKSCFVLWSRRKKVSKLKSGTRIRPDPLIFPQSPIISRHFPFPNFFKRQWRAGKNVLRGACDGAGTENGKYWKEFCKSLTFLGKCVFWGIIKIKQRNYNDKCISQFFALLPRAFSGVWAFKKSLCRISIFYFFYMRRFCPNVFGLLFYSYLGK